MEIKTASELLSKLSLTVLMENYQIVVKRFNVFDVPFTMKFNRHMHSSYEFHIISSGRCRVMTDDGEFEVQAGEFYLTAPGVYHEQIALSSGGYVEYALDCEINKIEDSSSEIASLVKLITETKCKPFGDRYKLIKLFEQALYEAYYRNIGFYNTLMNIVSSIIINTARTMASGVLVEQEFDFTYKDNDFRLVQLERFIEDNISTDITTEDIATYMGLSEKQICRIIKAKTGKSTKEFMLYTKHQRAKKLLETTELPMKLISHEIGFDSEVYFNQWFKRREGTSPGNYRSMINNANP